MSSEKKIDKRRRTIPLEPKPPKKALLTAEEKVERRRLVQANNYRKKKQCTDLAVIEPEAEPEIIVVSQPKFDVTTVSPRLDPVIVTWQNCMDTVEDIDKHEFLDVFEYEVEFQRLKSHQRKATPNEKIMHEMLCDNMICDRELQYLKRELAMHNMSKAQDEFVAISAEVMQQENVMIPLATGNYPSNNLMLAVQHLDKQTEKRRPFDVEALKDRIINRQQSLDKFTNVYKYVHRKELAQAKCRTKAIQLMHMHDCLCFNCVQQYPDDDFEFEDDWTEKVYVWNEQNQGFLDLYAKTKAEGTAPNCVFPKGNGNVNQLQIADSKAYWNRQDEAEDALDRECAEFELKVKSAPTVSFHKYQSTSSFAFVNGQKITTRLTAAMNMNYTFVASAALTVRLERWKHYQSSWKSLYTTFVEYRDLSKNKSFSKTYITDVHLLPNGLPRPSSDCTMASMQRAAELSDRLRKQEQEAKKNPDNQLLKDCVYNLKHDVEQAESTLRREVLQALADEIHDFKTNSNDEVRTLAHQLMLVNCDESAIQLAQSAGISVDGCKIQFFGKGSMGRYTLKDEFFPTELFVGMSDIGNGGGQRRSQLSLTAAKDQLSFADRLIR